MQPDMIHKHRLVTAVIVPTLGRKTGQATQRYGLEVFRILFPCQYRLLRWIFFSWVEQ